MSLQTMVEKRHFRGGEKRPTQLENLQSSKCTYYTGLISERNENSYIIELDEELRGCLHISYKTVIFSAHIRSHN